MRRTTAKTAKDQKTSSRAPAGEGGTTSTSAQHVCVQSKKIEDRRPCTAHAPPTGRRPTFAVPT
jgi:hypothetical protein